MSQDSLLAVLSGGVDSATAMAMMIDLLDPAKLGAVHFEYEQNHKVPEATAFSELCTYYGITADNRFHFVLPGIGGSALTSSVPSPTVSLSGVPSTYVPNRNMILIAHAGAIALQHGFDSLCIGVHEEDADYPDCTVEFANSIRRSLLIATRSSVSLYAPVIRMNKAAIIRTALKLHVPIEYTWTCYNPVADERYAGKYVSCGVCGACQLRLKAFASLNIDDPVPYAAREKEV